MTIELQQCPPTNLEVGRVTPCAPTEVATFDWGNSFQDPAAKAGASSAHSKRCRAMLKVPELREAFGVRPACWRFRFLVPMNS